LFAAKAFSLLVDSDNPLKFLILAMHYSKISTAHIAAFVGILGNEFVLVDDTSKEPYTHDHTEDLTFNPEVVLKPRNPKEISEILQICNRENIPVTPRGAGTGLSGGALAVHGGIILSMERFNQIIEIDERNMQVMVEPGVINEALQMAVAEKGLFYPPDPASKGSCMLGGNIAHASGGPRALKYGTTRDYVLNLEMVLPTGEIIWTGANTLKYATGYNLTHLMIGSEGTLGIVTKIVLKLIPKPAYTMLMLAPFDTPVNACKAVNAIFLAGSMPSVCEFVEPLGFQLAANMLQIHFNIQEKTGAYLLIEVDGNDTERMMLECETISNVLCEHGCEDVSFAQSADEKEYFWKLRRSIGEATKYQNTYKEEDTVVPRADLPVLYAGVKEIGKRYGFRSVCYGHAGDGNLHVNILKDELSDDFWNNQINDAITEIFQLCKQLKGTISGEHGIGMVQKRFMHIVMPEIQLELMRKIKLAFDPNGILNPGKIF
jgi:glycolate oxidase